MFRPNLALRRLKKDRRTYGSDYVLKIPGWGVKLTETRCGATAK
jgi:hypothetical protein